VPNRRNLVIVRAGNGSLHPGWLNAPGEERNWDLVVNYFGDDPDKFRGDEWLRIDGKGPKLRGLYEFIRGHEQLVRNYEYIWLAEDDLACKCRDINRLFDICHQENLKLVQPSLTHDSYFSHAITLHNPCFRLRYTTFVEVMAPCMSSSTLWKLLPTMNENVSGWGVDDLWSLLLAGDPDAIAILDAVQIRHTRPVGRGQLYDSLKAAGRSAWDERQELHEKYGIVRPRYWVRSAIRISGGRVKDGIRLLCLYGWGLLAVAPRLRTGWRGFPYFWLSAMFQQVKGRRQPETTVPPASRKYEARLPGERRGDFIP
jgi:hypothetical protein